jgi:hypothetical protein
MILLHCILNIWALLCALSLLAYYVDPECMENPEFEGQMHCISGIILCNRPYFGLLMSNFGGVLLLAIGLKAKEEEEDCTFLVCLAMVIYFSFTGILNYDVRDFKMLHFSSLFVLLVSGSIFIHMVRIPLWCVVAYDIVLAFFCVIMVSNFTLLKWTPPFMTIQAMLEIVWVLALCFCLWVYILDW